LGPSDDPEIEARRRPIRKVLFEQASPETRRRAVAESRERARLTATRDLLLRVFWLRQLTPSEQDEARIEACSDLATLDRWLDQSVTAASATEALA
jgi:hypothetical protein